MEGEILFSGEYDGMNLLQHLEAGIPRLPAI
jgi:hypothetical protein